MDFFKRAAELQEETVENRRYLHQNAEVGLELPRTKKYIKIGRASCRERV